MPERRRPRILNDSERKDRIDILTQQSAIYEKLHDAGELDATQMKKYLAVLRELDRLREIEKCRWDLMAFANRYFMGRLLRPESPSPPFHYDLAKYIQRAVNDNKRGHFLAFATSRSHAKTTLGTIITTLYNICFNLSPYIVICNNKQDGAADFLKTIKNELTVNDKLREDFGDLVGKTWGALDIVTANGVRVKAAGAGEAMRGTTHLGHRPRLLIIDDLEKDKDVESAKYRDEMEQWLNSTFIPLGDPGKVHVLYLGTTLHPDAVLVRVMKEDTRFTSRRYPAILRYPDNMTLWDEWEKIIHRRDFTELEVDHALAELERIASEQEEKSNLFPKIESEDEFDEFSFRSDNAGNDEPMAKVAGFYAEQFYLEHKEDMDLGAKVLWPERMSLYDLMVIRATKRKSFLTEYLNQPRDETTMLFTKFSYYDLSEVKMSDLDVYAAVDPSLGKNAKSDLSAIAVIGRHKDTGILYLLECDAKRRPPDKIIEDILEKAQRYTFRGFAVEGTAFQHFFKTEFEKRSALAGAYIPIREIKPNSDKALRIASLESLVSNGYIRFLPTQREVIADFEEVGSNGSLPRYDDRLDAIEMAVSLVRQNKRQISFSTL